MNRKRKFFFIIISILFTLNIYSQNCNIDYYGVVSTEIDSNMSKMTSDLYYTQLSEISNFNITDKRDGTILKSIPDDNIFSDSKLSFFTQISKETETDKWITKIYVVDKSKQEIHSKEKKYDSYYKILMESKNELKETIKQLIENDSSSTKLSTKNGSESFKAKQTIGSTEVLAGTWIGEENIEKIVILRGGRGFVIFKNGASMNISIELDSENRILITQKGKGNASFYPELPRNTALTAALNADPIQWILSFESNNSLVGIKNTLLPDGDSFTNGSIDISWNRIN